MKRIALFLLTNIAVLVVLSVVASIFGVDRFLTQEGLNLQALLIFSAIFGMGGSFISLAMSKWMAKRATGAQVITQPKSSAEMWLLQTVERPARVTMSPLARTRSRPCSAMKSAMWPTATWSRWRWCRACSTPS